MVGYEDNKVVFEKCDNVRVIRVALSQAREWSFYLAGLCFFFIVHSILQYDFAEACLRVKQCS